jgi:hypothetical protein
MHALGQLVHPLGEIRVDFRMSGQILRGEITLPTGVTGQFEYQGNTIDLREGKQII